MRENKQNLIWILTIAFILVLSVTSFAANGSFSVSKSSATLTEGNSTTFSISASNCEGQFTISSSNSSVVKVSSSSVWVTGSQSVTLTAVKAGTAKITISATDVGDTSENAVTGSRTISVTVKAKSSSSSSTGSSSNKGNTSNSGSTSKTTTTSKPKPSFTSVNQTVYTKSEVNVRSSYSSSSSAVGSMKVGSSVTRTGIGSNGWSKVIYNGQTAYINSSFLTTTKPVDKEDKKDDKNEEGKQDKEVKNENTEAVTVAEEQDENQLKLKELLVEGLPLQPEFDGNIYEYTLTLDRNDVSELNITATPNRDDAEVEIVGNTELQIGENIVTILVRASNEENGEEVATYQITVTVPESVEAVDNNQKLYLYIGIGVLALIIFIIILVTIKKRRRHDDSMYYTANVETEQTEKNKKTDELYRVDDDEKDRKRGKHF